MIMDLYIYYYFQYKSYKSIMTAVSWKDNVQNFFMSYLINYL